MAARIKYTIEQMQKLKNARKKNKNKNIDRRIQALQLHAEGATHKKTAEKTGFAQTYTAELTGKYRKNGIDAIVGNHYKCNHRNLSCDEEKALIESIKEKASKGQMTSVREFKEIYEKATGKTFGNLLK